MLYLTGIHALNLNCELETPGDWHQSALAWKNLDIRESDDSVYKEWGLEYNKAIPLSDKKYTTANHIRALLDLIDQGNFAVAQGMRDEFIDNEKYTELVFEKVLELRSNKNWEQIDEFIGKEYKLDWLRFKGVIK